MKVQFVIDARVNIVPNVFSNVIKAIVNHLKKHSFRKIFIIGNAKNVILLSRRIKAAIIVDVGISSVMYVELNGSNHIMDNTTKMEI